MANLDAAFGLRPYKMLGEGANTNGVSTYSIQTTATAGTTSVLFEGMPVIPLANGLINLCGNANGGTVPLLGAFIGCNYTDLNGTPVWSPRWPGTAAVFAGTEATAMVASHPDQLFLINCNAAISDIDVHRNANFATCITGNATTGQSLGELDVATLNSTAALNLRIVGFSEEPSSDDAVVAGRLAIVKLNNHFYNALAGI
jgi:hypothetical protein|tara:strand:- start:317 stop:919 length:603 start_codon:yes stop_codon:yes gene_type:complete